ncbi:5-oxoproline transporter, DUF979 family subunit [Sporanaerobacter acetigenes]
MAYWKDIINLYGHKNNISSSFFENAVTPLTPMAANFNIVPTAILEIKDKNRVMKTQAPIALILLIIHIVLMLVWAF